MFIMILGWFGFTYFTPLIHFRYSILRKLGLRKPAQITYEGNGTFFIDKLDPGESVMIEIPIKLK